MNSPIPAVTTSEPAGNGVRSWNNDSTSPAAITTDASYVPAFRTRQKQLYADRFNRSVAHGAPVSNLSRRR